jgi:hypothetical protein
MAASPINVRFVPKADIGRAVAAKLKLDSFRDDEAQRASEWLTLKLLPPGSPEPLVGLLLTICLPFAGGQKKAARYERCGSGLAMAGVSPEIGERETCTRLHVRSHLPKELNVVCH